MKDKAEQDLLKQTFENLPYHCSADSLCMGWITFLEEKKLLNPKDVSKGAPYRDCLTKKLTKDDELLLISEFLTHYKHECEIMCKELVDWTDKEKKKAEANIDAETTIITQQEFAIIMRAPQALVYLLDGKSRIDKID